MAKRNVYLLLFILIAATTVIVINYFTIRIQSAVRAYINGESEYSKGQKDALIYLYTYIETADTAYMSAFNESMTVPAGDNSARRSLLNNEKDDVTTVYFLKGRNHPADIPDMIWLFKMFQSTYMKAPIKVWGDAEPLIDQLSFIAQTMNTKIAARSLTPAERMLAVKQLSFISEELYKKESEFSGILGDTARKINRYLLYANILFILIIIGNITSYSIRMIIRLSNYNKNLETINKTLSETNKELDTLVYSVSHDLRSPITSVKGLLNILKEEDDIEKVKEYADLIGNTINKQDIFILEIIDFFKNKRSLVSYKEFSLGKMIDEVLANNKFSPVAAQIIIDREILMDIVYTDELRIKMILNNLISNAIKYSDEKKPVKTIFIKTQKLENDLIIEIEDNGIGIDKNHIGKIYDMFFVTSNSNKGTGLGLYILKQNLEKLKGRVDVRSELHEGTTFTIYIPLADK